jgi:hypothetical protein
MYVWNIRNRRLGSALGVKEGDIINLSPNPEYPDIPPPDANLLLLHATIAKVLKISGRGEVLDKVWQKFESLEALAADGSDAEVLMSVLYLWENIHSHLPNTGFPANDGDSK